jgi:DNA-binding MarR family transcriptional regulator
MAKTTTKKITKAARATALKAENPNITNSEIAKKIGSSGSYVSRILSEAAGISPTAPTTTTTTTTPTTTRGTTTRVTGTSRKYARSAATKSAAGVCSTETATVLSARAQMTQIVAAVGPKSAQTILDCVSQPCGG